MSKSIMHDIITKAKCLVDYQHFTRTLRGVAKNQGVSKSSVQRWVKQDSKCIEVMQKRKKLLKTKTQVKKDVTNFIEKSIEENPFITMNDLALLLHDQCGLKFSGRTIQRYATEMDYTYKKAVNVIDHDHDNGRVRAFCTRFEEAYNSGQLYSIDDAGFYVGDHPRKGRAKRGKRLAVGSSKTLRRSKFSLVMAINKNGIAAFEVIDHNYKKPDFVRFFTNMNLPTGSVIVLDNLRAHHSNQVQEVLATRGFECLFTPPYSPRCNPIEKIFGLLKPLYRKDCPSVRSTDKEAYNQVFLDLIHKYEHSSFKSTFDNTLTFIKETIHNIDTNPNFRFMGYDISSFILLNTSLPV